VISGSQELMLLRHNLNSDWSPEPQASILGSSSGLLCDFKEVKATILLSLTLKQIFLVSLYFIPGAFKEVTTQHQTLLHALLQLPKWSSNQQWVHLV